MTDASAVPDGRMQSKHVFFLVPKLRLGTHRLKLRFTKWFGRPSNFRRRSTAHLLLSDRVNLSCLTATRRTFLKVGASRFWQEYP